MRARHSHKVEREERLNYISLRSVECRVDYYVFPADVLNMSEQRKTQLFCANGCSEIFSHSCVEGIRVDVSVSGYHGQWIRNVTGR